MAAEISMPVHVRVGEHEGHWGDLAVPVIDGTVTERDVRRQLIAFLRDCAGQLEAELTEEVSDAAAHE
ncbi:hypothetical protein OG746_26715 [Streptomyces sp. NBC_01016]|uniref:hypothetical protein n=1 Tax=Streptomyces sp. NBC_01016 TaxID=2903720 RepID=UPI00225BD84C|nr:hypothetical protein [Streptomyces sp. NBC_01016]MCX4827177.1 hypothetical protein [Streptomyces sp. NBC_01016]MCX4832334.1 hypothetical protein [Streptomyces sp. NBC_01016]